MSIQRVVRTGYARNLANRWLIDTCTIVRKTRTSDGAGGFIVDETETSVPCNRARTNSQFERLVADRLGSDKIDTLFLPIGTVIKDDDELKHNGLRLNVQGAPDDNSLDTTTRVIVSH